MNRLFILGVTMLSMTLFSLKANAQLSDKEKLEARRDVLKKTSELNALQIQLNEEYEQQKELKLDYQKAKSEADIYAAKNQSKLGADVKAAGKLAKMVKKSTNISSKLTKQNVEIEKIKSKIEKVRKELDKLNGSVIIYTDKEHPFKSN